MPADRLPEDGELRLGSVTLSGKRVRAQGRDAPNRGGPVVAWVTDGPVREAGRIWLELSDLTAQTGLQPVLSPRGAEEFMDPCDIAEVDRLDGGAIVTHLWEEKAVDDGDEESAAWVDDWVEPFDRDFPGVAAPGDEPRTAAELTAALDPLPPLYVYLAAAGRPADVVAMVGWETTDAWDNWLPALSAVLRSWEDRFGARLLQLGPGAEIRLLVSRPPRSGAQILLTAAELWAFGNRAWGGYEYTSQNEAESVSGIAHTVVRRPIWGFWWD